MTDSSALLPNAQAVSSDCLFNLKPSAVRSRSYRASILPTNASSFTCGQTAILYVPGGRRNTYLDCSQSYIRYTVKNNDAANTLNFDGSGASVINRLDLFHGSNNLETVQQYNVLYGYITDMQMNPSSRSGLSPMYGFNASATGYRAGGQIAVSASQTVCMPLLSGVIGLGSDKMLPIGLLVDDIRVEITFEQQVQGMVASAAAGTAWSISSLELELCIVELSDEGEHMVRNITPPERPIYLHGNSWRHYVSTLAAATSGMYSTLVPARFASVKSLVLCPRRATEINGATSYSTTSRCNPCFSTYGWRVGASLIPNKYITLENTNTTQGYAEAFAETIKAWHGLNSYYISTALPTNIYNTADGAFLLGPVTNITGTLAANSYQNGFVIAQELESFANRSDVLLAGLNTLSSQVFFETTINSAGPTVTTTLDFYANYDHIIVLENGILSVRF